MSCSGLGKMKFKSIYAIIFKYSHIQHSVIITTAGDHSQQELSVRIQADKVGFFVKKKKKKKETHLQYFLNQYYFWNASIPKDMNRIYLPFNY